MNFFTKTLFSLGGANLNIIPFLTTKTRTHYRVIGISLLVNILLAFLAGCEMGYQYTSNIFVFIPIGLLWGVLIGTTDYQITNFDSPSNKYAIYTFRVIFGITSSIISVLSLLVFLNINEIENTLKTDNQNIKSSIINSYNIEYKDRYQILKSKKDNQNEYHNSVCQKEALNEYAGPIYSNKHKKCLLDLEEINLIKIDLDKKEETYIKYKNNQLYSIDILKYNDYFSKLRVLFSILKNDGIKFFISSLFFIMLLCFELSTLCLKILMPKFKDYEKAEEIIEKNTLEIIENKSFEIANLNNNII